MDKKIKIILLLLGVLTAVYFFRPGLPISTTPKVSVELAPALSKKPYDEELQKEFLLDLRGKEKLPKFEDFPADEFSNNKNITVDINSDPIGQLYRTAIRNHVENFGVDFSGKYSIAQWGCGSTCQYGAVVDADTGHVYPLPDIMANGFDSRKDSRLLIQNPIIIGGDWPRPWYRMRYWEWNGKIFRSLGVYKVDLAKKEIVEVE